MAGLHRYFTPQTRSECLPDPRGPLSREIPSSAITAANSEVKAILGNESKKERGHASFINRKAWSLCYQFAKIKFAKKWKPAIRESLIPRKFPAIRYHKRNIYNVQAMYMYMYVIV